MNGARVHELYQIDLLGWVGDITNDISVPRWLEELLMAGVDIRTVAQLMGHRTIQMTMRYAHLAPEHNQGAVEKLVSP